MRSVALTIRPRPYIEASHSIGLTTARILLRHVIPNALPPVIVVATLSAASAILAEAGLSFLGPGREAAHADLGATSLPTGRQPSRPTP